MFELSNGNTGLPIKIWLQDEGDLEQGCLEQAYNISNLPFVQDFVCLMPDAHQGMGMPIGGVIAALDNIIPNAVGVDIGCGMAFESTNIPVSVLLETQTGNGSLVQAVAGDILRNIPLGFNHHKKPQPSYTLDLASDDMEKYARQPSLAGQIEAGYYQIGTLGGGNHFIELQADEKGMLGIMLHSGSRNFGKQVCDFFNDTARQLNGKWHSRVPDSWKLAHLPGDSQEGRDYISWMKLAMDFAFENRLKMMLAVKAILEKWIGRHTDLNIEYTGDINCHHNYAALERHYGKDVWVHRKGAVRAEKGEQAVIPGAMGSYSYVVEGLGNSESYNSSSHGAGRRYSRKGARQSFTVEEVMADLNKSGVVLGKHNKKDVAEESRFAYKDIDWVMANQTDLVKPVKKLKTIGVVKG